MAVLASRSLRGIAAALWIALCSMAPAMAQMPVSGVSLGSSLGLPAIAWQQIDTKHSFAAGLNLAPTAPGGSGSVAASRLLGQGRWLLSAGLASASYSRLMSSGGQVGLTFTPAFSRYGLLQATVGAGFEAGNSVEWQSGLWPVSSSGSEKTSLLGDAGSYGSTRDFMTGIRWAPAPLLSLNMAAHGGSLSEQEIGLDTAFSPALCFSLGFDAQQHEGAGSLASLALRWQPQAQSAFALGLETDIARQYWSTPLPGEGLGSGDALLGVSRANGQTATALIDAPISAGLALHLAMSLPIGGVARYTAFAPGSWTASLTHSL